MILMKMIRMRMRMVVVMVILMVMMMVIPLKNNYGDENCGDNDKMLGKLCRGDYMFIFLV